MIVNELNLLKTKMLEHRKVLHQIPEGGYKEVKTAEYVTNVLMTLGYEPISVVTTGVIAYREGKTKDCIAFRSDMDGLPIKEETDLSYASTNGYMHACGHDGHMSILLGFAEYLTQIEQLEKSVLLVFQPAEEGPGGALPLMNTKLFERYHVKNVFGLHIYPGLKQGTIGTRGGVLTAQTGEFNITIKGKSGHGAMPHTAIDALVAAAGLINGYQTIISRNINTIEGGVVTIGTITGGERRNIICETVEMEGTIRALSEEIYQIIKLRMAEINKGLEVMYNVQVEMTFDDLYPCILNDKVLVSQLMESSLKDDLIEMEPMMIAEDFAYYQRVVPGVFLMLGSRNEELGYTYPLHSCHFNFDKEVLVDGVKLYNQICKILNVY